MEKASLPIKTKIAVWGMIIVGGLEMASALYSFLFFPTVLLIEYLWKSGMVIYGLLLIFSGYFLIVERKKWAWWLAEIILFLSLFIQSSTSTLLFRVAFSSFGLFYRYGALISYTITLFKSIFFILLVLLLLDRKNFWKIAT